MHYLPDAQIRLFQSFQIVNRYRWVAVEILPFVISINSMAFYHLVINRGGIDYE
nr:MAG TPA: hypothetical protein [Caudoviricetes sp.]